MVLTGVDIETTGLNYHAGHRLIQVGLVLPGGSVFGSYVQPVGNMVVDPEAMHVNRIDLDMIKTAAPKGPTVDVMLCSLLESRRFKPGSLTAVGWNVGSFDLPFLRHELPGFASYFSHRAVDLTAVALMHELKTGKRREELKDEIHAAVAAKLRYSQRHDAVYDAIAAIEAVQFFLNMDKVQK